MAYTFLSHKLDPNDLGWPGTAVLTIDEDSAIGKNGAPFNAVVNHIPNHFGTHFDAPLHFNPKGIPLHELPAEYFAYKGDEVLMLDIPKKAKEVIMLDEIMPFADKIKKAKLVLFHTGFSKLRKSEPLVYQSEGPCIHPDISKYLVENCPNLLCIGVDFIAIGSPANDMAPDIHQWLLGYHTDKFVTAIEDMDMEPLVGKKINFITLGPLRVVGADSGQVSIIADVE